MLTNVFSDMSTRGNIIDVAHLGIKL